MGYLDNELATKETYDNDGFLHTGDLGVIDAQGLVTIHDRIKELIKVGYKYSCSTLNTHC
jgi:4-coumarate--CoA ligase